MFWACQNWNEKPRPTTQELFYTLLKIELKTYRKKKINNNICEKFWKGESKRRGKARMNSSIEVANAAAKAAYRNLLRAVRNHVGKEDHKSHFTDFIKHEFRINVSSQNPPNLKLAQDYTFYLNSVHHQKVLYFQFLWLWISSWELSFFLHVLLFFLL